MIGRQSILKVSSWLATQPCSLQTAAASKWRNNNEIESQQDRSPIEIKVRTVLELL
jgi:hypothetical protein